MESLKEKVLGQITLAKKASRQMALQDRRAKDSALAAIAEQLQVDADDILTANEQDLARAEADGQPASYLDRLRLTPARIRDLVDGLQQLISLEDPVGQKLEQWTRPNGLAIEQVRVPLGVIGMVYEARPNVTIDAAAIALKTGNATVLRGSHSAVSSNLALVKSIRAGLANAGITPEAVQYLPFAEHASVDILCTANGLIDVIIPRGGAGLINRVLQLSSVPVLETGVGNCHIFVDQTAQYEMTKAIVINAKTSRPAVCNAAETLLLHRDWPLAHQNDLLKQLIESGVEIRACEQTRALHSDLAAQLQAASKADWDAEFSDLILAVRIVDSLADAINHIAEHSTGHSEAILTEDAESASRFLATVDSTTVYHNASTRFTDGGEFGFGAEIGISTQKLHARGPMGLPALTSYKYVVRGTGQIR
ncbi:gamma-glutamyl phosphate reductase [Brevibacillus reuszeri]|uniref:Gamma-glutamyl phosphate reductase n=1 Tax=Brevibacillus reuszeri TaxID=54915 RepID=A0A0K9YNK1_9BACL|nr:glutamate-5-semialdehyde dehydrogenase [Brevibacillus reuszeri]KNB69745.1 gamma-glutamyl phosphate reductase [Brevibacillus reuszeri]MED1858087.1 glutamate-5-semialdehyde dehydrogenase [Brevibacillus reuszeri]GED68921.1 gamma-glutamyl phosphate reductase [Brevibacillus reuszeri]